MRQLTFILTLLIGTNCFASSHFDILRDTLTKGRTLTEFKVKLDTKFNDFRLSQKNERLTRSLDFGFTQIIYEIEINYNGNHVKDFRFFLVTTSNDSIILGTLQELDYYEKIKKSENYIQNATQINNYIEKHKIKFNISLSKKDFVKQLTELIIYGYGCSYGGEYYPPEARQMTSYVEKKNYEQLSLWLRQISPELQAYGVDGLLQLDKKGIEIKQSDKELIEQLKQRNANIYHCSGCIYGISTTIAEIIKWQKR